MDTRTLWSQELDEDPPDATGSAAADPAPGDADAEAPADDDRPGGRALGWLAALTALALLLMLLGWWLGRDTAESAGPAAPPAAVAEEAQVANPGDGAGPSLTGSLPGGVGGTGGGVDVAARSGGLGGKGGPGGQAVNGTNGSTGTRDGGSVAGEGTGSGAGSDGGSGGGSGTGSGATGSGVTAGVGAEVGDGKVAADVDLGVLAVPGGAVTSVVITACTKLGNLNPKLDASATVTWANGYQATGVKITGLTLLNLLDPGTLKLSLGGAPYTVPAGATVKVSACLGL